MINLLGYWCGCVVVGDILVFMPGQEDIETTCDVITGKTVLVVHHNRHELLRSLCFLVQRG